MACGENRNTTKYSVKVSCRLPSLASELHKLWPTVWVGLSNVCYSLLYDRIPSNVPDKILPSPTPLIAKGGGRSRDSFLAHEMSAELAGVLKRVLFCFVFLRFKIGLLVFFPFTLLPASSLEYE